MKRLEFQRKVLPHIDPPPPHWEWADGPTECTFLLSGDFKSLMWDSRLPDPDYSAFISTCDMTSAYAYHRRAIQVLQTHTDGRWILKMPAHAFFIEALLNEYPDASVIWAHRDPTTVVASFLDLIGFAHTISMGAADADWIRSTYPQRLVEYVRRGEAALESRDVHHLHYDLLLADPIAAVAEIYAWLGAGLTSDTAAAMRAWLEADPIRRPRSRT